VKVVVKSCNDKKTPNTSDSGPTIHISTSRMAVQDSKTTTTTPTTASTPSLTDSQQTPQPDVKVHQTPLLKTSVVHAYANVFPKLDTKHDESTGADSSGTEISVSQITPPPSSPRAASQQSQHGDGTNTKKTNANADKRTPTIDVSEKSHPIKSPSSSSHASEEPHDLNANNNKHIDNKVKDVNTTSQNTSKEHINTKPVSVPVPVLSNTPNSTSNHTLTYEDLRTVFIEMSKVSKRLATATINPNNIPTITASLCEVARSLRDTAKELQSVSASLRKSIDSLSTLEASVKHSASNVSILPESMWMCMVYGVRVCVRSLVVRLSYVLNYYYYLYSGFVINNDDVSLP